MFRIKNKHLLLMNYFSYIRRISRECNTSLVSSFLKMTTLASLNIDNAALRELPVDTEHGSRQRTVQGACFSLVDQSPVDKPKLVAFSRDALELLGLDENSVKEDDFVEYFAGNKKLKDSQPAAHCYCGHQFGYFSGQLGDGAAMYLGEVINDKNERWELQLKGAGLTPYSRQADGRKVLRSSIREFLCSEAMHHLGIPTTRAGTCVTSDTRVVRDMFYDGHPKMERCTIVSRIAQTFIRFGSFEIFKDEDRLTGRSGPSARHKDILPVMLDYVIKSFYKEIASEYAENKEAMYLAFYKEIIRRTAKLVAMWQCVGFCHGVLNTDNMSIVGVTIDYGPYGFMDFFDADFICNSSDNNGRYSYKKQPEICKWNLMKLGEMLQDVLSPDIQTKQVLDEIYDKAFSTHYYDTMMRKIGLSKIDGVEPKHDEDLIQSLLLTMQRTSCDFTNTFCAVMDTDWFSETASDDARDKLMAQCEPIESLKKRFSSAVNMTKLMSMLQLAESHPQVLAQLGISPEQIQMMVLEAEKTKEISKLSAEEKKSRDIEEWTKWLVQYRKRLMLEFKNVTDQQKIDEMIEAKKKDMTSVNPRIVLRNYMAQQAIEAAEEGDFSKVQDLLEVLEHPYDEYHSENKSEECNTELQNCRTGSTMYTAHAPSWSSGLRVS